MGINIEKGHLRLLIQILPIAIFVHGSIPAIVENSPTCLAVVLNKKPHAIPVGKCCSRVGIG
jgi:hypothetical protein